MSFFRFSWEGEGWEDIKGLIAYGEVGVEGDGVGAGLESREDGDLFRGGCGTDNLKGLVAVGSEDDVIKEIFRLIVSKESYLSVFLRSQ